MGAGPAGAGLAHNKGGARASCTSIFSLVFELVSSNSSPDLGFAQVSSYPTVHSPKRFAYEFSFHGYALET